jgi:hypothetical protein
LASQRNYYAVKKEDGTWDDSVEKLLGDTVEFPGLPVIQKLAAGKTRLNWDERKYISLLIAVQEMRTPSARERARVFSQLLNERIFSEIRAADPEQKTIDLIGKSGERSTVTLDEMKNAHQEMCDDHSMEIHRSLMGPAFKLAEYYRHMIFTVYYRTGGTEYVTTDTPVIRVFHNTATAPLGTGINRSDLEVRFPLSHKAFLTLSHDEWLIEQLGRAQGSKRDRLIETLPEVRVQQATESKVIALNKAHARHARRWVFAPREVDWAVDVLSEPSVASRIVDLSNRDLIHFQSAVNYDPKIDSGVR